MGKDYAQEAIKRCLLFKRIVVTLQSAAGNVAAFAIEGDSNTINRQFNLDWHSFSSIKDYRTVNPAQRTGQGKGLSHPFETDLPIWHKVATRRHCNTEPDLAGVLQPKR